MISAVRFGLAPVDPLFKPDPELTPDQLRLLRSWTQSHGQQRDMIDCARLRLPPMCDDTVQLTAPERAQFKTLEARGQSIARRLNDTTDLAPFGGHTLGDNLVNTVRLFHDWVLVKALERREAMVQKAQKIADPKQQRNLRNRAQRQLLTTDGQLLNITGLASSLLAPDWASRPQANYAGFKVSPPDQSVILSLAHLDRHIQGEQDLAVARHFGRPSAIRLDHPEEQRFAFEAFQEPGKRSEQGRLRRLMSQVINTVRTAPQLVDPMMSAVVRDQLLGRYFQQKAAPALDLSKAQSRRRNRKRAVEMGRIARLNQWAQVLLSQQ